MVATFGMAPGDTFDQHTHGEHQLAWAARGVLIASAATGTWVLPPTRALWIPAFVPHQVVASGRSEMRALYIRTDGCPVTWPQPQPVAASALLAALIHHLADDQLDTERRARAEAVLMDALEPVSYATIEAALPTDPRARDVANALLADPADPRDLAGWGREVGASARTLARAFLADTGLPFGRWRTAARLQAALPRLAAGDSVATVARHVGYETPSAFVAAFRRETGLTPGRYFRSSGGSSATRR
jgi:AraC-like DNA-binding protein